jgi:hypothetical protein
VSFEAEFRDKLGEEFIEDTFGRVEGLRDVSVGKEEMLD